LWAAEQQEKQQQPISSAFVSGLVAKKPAKSQLTVPREAGPVSTSGSQPAFDNSGCDAAAAAAT